MVCGPHALTVPDSFFEVKESGPHLQLPGQNPQCSQVTGDLCAVIKIRESTGLENWERSLPGQDRED